MDGAKSGPVANVLAKQSVPGALGASRLSHGPAGDRPDLQKGDCYAGICHCDTMDLITAIHEAGHAVAYRRLFGDRTFRGVWLSFMTRNKRNKARPDGIRATTWEKKTTSEQKRLLTGGSQLENLHKGYDMRIGTWNMDGKKRSDDRIGLLRGHNCNIWLLTELNSQCISADGKVAGYHCHYTQEFMTADRYWAAILSDSPIAPLPDPHPASAAAVVSGITYCSTILPWRSCGSGPPWVGENLTEKTQATIKQLLISLPQRELVWGGDWNHSLEGREFVGSNEGRDSLKQAIELLELQVPTSRLASRLDGCLSIDHIAIPKSWQFKKAQGVPANGMSDHDAYVVDVEPT